MTDDEFYRQFASLLQEMAPGRDLSGLSPDTHLWLAGYVDSLAMLEIISFVEDLIGGEIPLDRDFLPNFFTMKTIYESYVAPVAQARSR
jgi:acyl carrier protein